MNIDNQNTELLVELLAQVKRIQRLDNIESSVSNEVLTLSDVVSWESMFEYMIYTAGKYTVMSQTLADVYESVTTKTGLFITPKAYGMLIAKTRRVSTGHRKVTTPGEMLTVPGDGCVYIIRYDVDQSTRPATKTVTDTAVITLDRKGMGEIKFIDSFADVVKEAYKQF